MVRTKARPCGFISHLPRHFQHGSRKESPIVDPSSESKQKVCAGDKEAHTGKGLTDGLAT